MIDNILLAPYYLILKARHFLYDKGIRKAVRAEVPAIGFGNITVGGTGKTPHTELAVRTLLSLKAFQGKHIAVLSRGYRRKSKGFQQVTTDSSAAFAGDEPLQMKNKFPDITVAVDADRVEGCGFLARPERLGTSKKARKCRDMEFPAADVIILDDVLQHRALKPHLSILLIDYHHPVCKDMLLPLGRLRDLRERTFAADLIIISKCPTYLDDTQRLEWAGSLKLRGFDLATMQGTNPWGRKQTLLFSTISYCTPTAVFPEGDPHYVYAPRAIVFTGIADDTPLMAFLSGKYRISGHLVFGDHHRFTEPDIRTISGASESEPTALVVTTEKDSQRIRDMENIPETLKKRMFQVPIEAAFLSEKETAIFCSLLNGLVQPGQKS